MSIPKIEIDDRILKSRELFLYENVNEKTVPQLIKEIKTLDAINKKPIKLWINSSGGNTSSGFALINTMRQVKSPIYTIINIMACSMASHIAVAGNKRYIYENGWHMAHDMSGGIDSDYSGKVKYRAKWIEQHYSYLENNYKKFTNLTKKDLEIARNGELWLNAQECLEKGVVDKILKIGE